MSTLARATIKSYDVSTHSATVQIIGSLAVWLDAVPVSVGISPADVVAGRECGVIFFTDDNPSDASVVTIHNVVPTGWPLNTSHRLRDADNNTYVEVENTANEDKVRMGVGGTLRYLLQTASPHHTLTGDTQLGTTATASGHWHSLNRAPTVGVVLDIGVNGGTATYTGIEFLNSATKPIINDSPYTGIQCAMGITVGAGSTVATMDGLVFFNQPTGSGSMDYSHGVTVYGANSNFYSGTVAHGRGLYIPAPAFFAIGGANTSTWTEVIGVDIENQGKATRITSAYALRIAAQSGSTNNYPISVDGVASTVTGSVHRPNWQFGSLTRAFGGGDGVIGLAYATTNPTTNPGGGVVVYASAATGDFYVRGAGGQICKLPTGGAVNVTGSRGGNAALANLLTTLALLGLITDGTT